MVPWEFHLLLRIYPRRRSNAEVAPVGDLPSSSCPDSNVATIRMSESRAGGEDADDPGSPLDLLLQPLGGVDRVESSAVLTGKCGIGSVPYRIGESGEVNRPFLLVRAPTSGPSPARARSGLPVVSSECCATDSGGRCRKGGDRVPHRLVCGPCAGGDPRQGGGGLRADRRHRQGNHGRRPGIRRSVRTLGELRAHERPRALRGGARGGHAGERPHTGAIHRNVGADRADRSCNQD